MVNIRMQRCTWQRSPNVHAPRYRRDLVMITCYLILLLFPYDTTRVTCTAPPEHRRQREQCSQSKSSPSVTPTHTKKINRAYALIRTNAVYRTGENCRPKKPSETPTSRTWLVSHVLRVGLESRQDTAVR